MLQIIVYPLLTRRDILYYIYFHLLSLIYHILQIHQYVLYTKYYTEYILYTEQISYSICRFRDFPKLSHYNPSNFVFMSCVKCRICSYFSFIYCFLSNPGFSQRLYLLDLIVWQDVQVAHNVGAIPLILFFHGLQQETWVHLPILVATKQTAAPCFVLTKYSG